MRIVAGTLRGRRLVAPRGETTRPTADRVREALFSALDSLGAIVGASVLDAFAGSGALGLEALSRGAARATFVDGDRAAQEAVRANIASLGLSDRAALVRGDVSPLAQRGALPGAPFALLLLDPPYRIDKSEVRGLIESLAASGALEPGAVVVWEHSSACDVVWPDGFDVVRDKRYGDTSVAIAIAKSDGE